MLREGMTPTGIGIAVGLAGTLLLSRVLSDLIYGVGPIDIPTFTIVSAVLAFAALLACWLPARRASRTDPISSLRMD